MRRDVVLILCLALECANAYVSYSRTQPRCPSGKKAVLKPEGWTCMWDYHRDWNSQETTTTTTTTTTPTPFWNRPRSYPGKFDNDDNFGWHPNPQDEFPVEQTTVESYYHGNRRQEPNRDGFSPVRGVSQQQGTYGYPYGHQSPYERTGQPDYLQQAMTESYRGSYQSSDSQRFPSQTNYYGFTTPEPDQFDYIRFPTPRDDHNGQDQRHNPSSSIKRKQHIDPSLVAPLPSPNDYLDSKEKRCLDLKMVYWPKDKHCYHLLQQGPCYQDEWLVLQNGAFGEIQVVCQERPCPCRSESPFLCEVWYEHPDRANTCASGCKVSLAAAQDKICSEGEQLLVTPYGKGVCGCQQDNPPHVRWEEDNKCYPLHRRGPCPANHTLQFSPTMGSPLCVPLMCPDESFVLHTDGRCYQMDTRGPCDEESVFQMDKDNRDPRCKPRSHVMRIFDLAPNRVTGESNPRGSIVDHLKVEMNDCSTGSDTARCDRKAKSHREQSTSAFGIHLHDGFEGAKKFLVFLWSFKGEMI